MVLKTSPFKRLARRMLPLLVGFFATLTALPSVAQSTTDLPDLGDSSARMLSPEREREYSEGLLRQLRNYDVSVEDAELVEYLDTLALRLVQSAGRTETSFHFVLADVPVINAFASPGGLIVAFSGLMLAADNESELAGVLAHALVEHRVDHQLHAL